LVLRGELRNPKMKIAKHVLPPRPKLTEGEKVAELEAQLAKRKTRSEGANASSHALSVDEHRLDWKYARSVERWSAWEHEGLADVREGKAPPW